ncbi:MAG: autotransporter-associated beta strand repeat-containing protein [Opitutaceae bacterium]
MPDIFPLLLTKSKSRRPFACALLALLISLPLDAQTRYWDTNGAGFGASDQFGSAPGVWDAATTANWSTDASGNQPSGLWVAGATASFVAGDFHNGTYTVTVDGTVDVAAINFHNGDLTLDGGVLDNLALVSVSVSRAAFINSAISGTQAFTKNGDGRLTLSGANSYTGSTLLQGGRLTFVNQGAFYDGVIDATTAAKLDVSNTAEIVWGVGGADGFTASDLTTLRQHGTYAAGTRFGVDTSTADGGTFTLGADLAGLNDVGFLKTGTGTLVLTGDNTSTGDTTVQTGILIYANRGAFYDGVVSTETADRLTIGTNNGHTAIASFGVGGADGFTAGEIAILAANANLDGNASLGLDTRNAVGGVFDYDHTTSNRIAKTGSGSLRITGDSSGTGQISVLEGTLLLGDGGHLTLATSLIQVTGAAVFNHSNDFTFSGNVGGTGTVTKTGSGTLTSSGLAGSVSLLVTGGALDVGDGAYIDGTTVTVSDGASFHTGAGTWLQTSLTVEGVGSRWEADTQLGSGAFDTDYYTVLTAFSGASGGPTSSVVRDGGTITGGHFVVGAYNDVATQLSVAAGGEVSADGAIFVGYENSASTSVSVAGAGAALTVADTLYIGGSNGSGTVNVGEGGTITTRAIVLGHEDGAGTFNLNADGTLVVGTASGTAVSTGSGSAIFNLAGGTLRSNGTHELTMATDATLVADTTTTFDTNGQNGTITGSLSGTGALIKTGTGTLYLNAANTYTGATTINEGTVRLGEGLSFTSTAITVGSGASLHLDSDSGFTLDATQTLGGSGTITGGLLTLGSGATLAPGSSPGTLTFTNGLTLDAGAILNFELGTASDLIAVTGGTLTGPSAGTVTLNLSDSGGFAAGTYTLFDYTSATVSDFDTTDFSLGTSIAGYDYSFTLTGTALQLIAATSAVPEPSTYAAILGLGALGLVAWRKRRAALTAK